MRFIPLLIAAVACGPGSPPGGPCQSADDCAAACHPSTDCGGSVCRDGACRSPVGGSCRTLADCANDDDAGFICERVCRACSGKGQGANSLYHDAPDIPCCAGLVPVLQPPDIASWWLGPLWTCESPG